MGIDLLVEEEANSGGISLGLAGDYAIQPIRSSWVGWRYDSQRRRQIDC
jgi:hypothetical protein